MFTIENITPFLTSLKLGGITTAILLVVMMPPAWLLGRKNFLLKPLAETLLTLPMILPPTVLGFYIVLFLSPQYATGAFFQKIAGTSLLFTFPGLVLASCIASAPFMILALKDGFSQIDISLIEASYTLGKSPLQTMKQLVMPLMRPYIFTASMTTFAHTMGLFGVVLMVGGNIPGVTRVASIAVYEKVEELDYLTAHGYSVMLMGISVLLMLSANIWKQRLAERRHDDKSVL